MRTNFWNQRETFCFLCACVFGGVVERGGEVDDCAFH